MEMTDTIEKISKPAERYRASDALREAVSEANKRADEVSSYYREQLKVVFTRR